MTERSGELEDFFLIVPPGFEKVACRELRYWSEREHVFPVELNSEKGGISFSAPLAFGLRLNRRMKIPVRILLRVESFRCRDFNKLFKKVSEVDWNRYVGADTIVWQATAKNSRVKIQSRIEETCREAFMKYRKGHEPKKQGEVGESAVHVRLVDDVCFLSVDLSGEPLYKRGVKKKVSRAPIRENLAAGLLWMLWDGEEPGRTVLIDPMMGTGTFLIEALSLLEPVGSRGFSFERNPDWKQLARDGFEPGGERLFLRVYGFDRDAQMVEAARENLRERDNIDLNCRDLFAEAGDPIVAESDRWVVVNPPYDRRLRGDGDGTEYYRRLISAVVGRWQPEKLGILVPRTHSSRIDKPDFFTNMERIDFENGGFPVTFFRFSK